MTLETTTRVVPQEASGVTVAGVRIVRTWVQCPLLGGRCSCSREENGSHSASELLQGEDQNRHAERPVVTRAGPRSLRVTGEALDQNRPRKPDVVGDRGTLQADTEWTDGPRLRGRPVLQFVTGRFRSWHLASTGRIIPRACGGRWNAHRMCGGVNVAPGS